MNMRHPLYALTFCLIASAGTAHATSCMVMGDKTALVASEQGEKSPAFLTDSCENLRLVSGKAMVTWVSRDGKPQFSPIGTDGPERLPNPGAEERSANLVWTELTSNREAARPAFMRALGEERPTPVFIPGLGLELGAGAGIGLKIFAGASGNDMPLLEKSPDSAGAIKLERDTLLAGQVYTLQWQRQDGPETWRWKVLSDDEQARIDTQLQQIEMEVSDIQQRRILTAMLYEQLKLHVNRELVLDTAP